MYTSCVIEIVLSIGLIFAVYPLYVGAIAFVHLLVAAAAVWKGTTGRWLWNIGGYEYCVFWAICCLVVAMHYR
jgi:putative oxidoreductase